MDDRPIVPKVFKCPKCNHEDAVEVKLDKKTLLGDISCRICGANYQTRIHSNFKFIFNDIKPNCCADLTDEVDVFCE